MKLSILSETHEALRRAFNESTISMEIPEDVLTSLNKTHEELISDMWILTALSFFKNGKLSLGKATELAGIELL